MRQGWKGYIFGREIDGNFIPQRVQNLVIRDYVSSQSGDFELSTAEYGIKNCYMMLEALLEMVSTYECLVFYSLFMLPPSKSESHALLMKVLNAGTEIHFALERIAVRNCDDIQSIEDILMVKQLAANSPVGSLIE